MKGRTTVISRKNKQDNRTPSCYHSRSSSAFGSSRYLDGIQFTDDAKKKGSTLYLAGVRLQSHGIMQIITHLVPSIRRTGNVMSSTKSACTRVSDGGCRCCLSLRVETCNTRATHRSPQIVPVRSHTRGIACKNGTRFYLLVKTPVVAHTDFVCSRHVGVAAVGQHLTPVHLVARPVSEQTLRILAPLGAVWWKRSNFAGVGIDVHPWPWRRRRSMAVSARDTEE